MNEFLKLCNLFSQDLIDRNVLVYRVQYFIGGNLDLFNWFKAFVSYEGEDQVLENRPQAPTGRPALSNCRGLGPSYRLLPRRVSFPFHFVAHIISLPFTFYCARSPPIVRVGFRVNCLGGSRLGCQGKCPSPPTSFQQSDLPSTNIFPLIDLVTPQHPKHHGHQNVQ